MRTHDSRGKRTDAARPSVFEPSEYMVLGYYDLNAPPGYDREWASYLLKTYGTSGRGDGSCDHCGHYPLRWVAVVVHEPTQKLWSFGEQCSERCELPGRDAMKLHLLKKRNARLAQEAKWRVEAAEKAAAWYLADPDHQAAADYLASLGRDDPGWSNPAPEFLLDVRRKLVQYGDLSPRQVAAVLKFKARAEAPKPEQVTPSAPLAEGVHEVEGEVLTVRWQESQFGGQLKMLVLLTDGNRAWGTVPSAVDHVKVGGGTRGLESGDRVRFTAQFERSRDDEHFGFYKRPRKAALVETGVAA